MTASYILQIILFISLKLLWIQLKAISKIFMIILDLRKLNFQKLRILCKNLNALCKNLLFYWASSFNELLDKLRNLAHISLLMNMFTLSHAITMQNTFWSLPIQGSKDLLYPLTISLLQPKKRHMIK